MKKAIFFDCDGTLIIDKHYNCKITDVEFTENIVEAIRLFNKEDFLIIVITNQSGIGRGFFTEEDVFAFHSFIKNELIKKVRKLIRSTFVPIL